LPRLWIAAIATAVALLGIAPAAAHATVTSSQILTWTSSQSGTPQNASYLISYDNDHTTLTVSGTASGIGSVDIACFYGAGSSFVTLASNVAVNGGAFNTGPRPLFTGNASTTLAGRACRLRAIPAGGGSSDDTASFAGPQVAVSEVGLPSATVSGQAANFYVVATTLNGSAAWDAAGSCGPYAAPFDPSLGQGNFAIDCMGSLLGANLPSNGTRSEVQVDGQNAYDAASAQALSIGTENLVDFPSLTENVVQDPSNGAVSSQSTEAWGTCANPVAYPPTSADCPVFATPKVTLERDITTSDGGLVVTMTDTWSSADGQPHSLDLLYDDYVGLKSSVAQPGYEFPGHSVFSPYSAGTTLPGPGTGPGSILVRTNLAAADGDTSEAVGAITYSTPPTGFTFVGDNEFEEHQALEVPAAGSVRLTHIYSTGYTVGQTQALSLDAQDLVEPPALAITPPAGGTTVSAPTVDLSGTALAGSGITSLSVAGQSVPVTPGGSWSAEVPLNPGSNTITALATDRAGANVQAQVTIVYQPPAAATPPVARCKVPRIKGMKLPGAERALRRAHCRVGRIKHEASKKVRKGRAVGTNPPAGHRMRAGSKVELYVSKGP
jgi:Glucodextranase, domain B/PASTA domain